MSDTQVVALRIQPGVTRDGTVLDRTTYVDSQHVRFCRGRPRKMGGYRRITDGLSGPISAVNIWAQSTLNSISTFSTQGIESVLTDKEGVGASIITRTPAGFTVDDRIVWSTDVLYDAAAGSPQAVILAHGAYSGTDIEDQTATPVYVGDAIGSGVFTAVAGVSTSGGVLATHPFAVIFGENGSVTWSNENEPQNYTTGSAGTARVTANKLVAGQRMPSSSGPGALLVSLDATVAMSYIGGSAIFRFTEISTDSTILASRSLVSYASKFYWVGTDRFFVSDGASVQEIPNQANIDWFFDNLNYSQRQKVWGVIIPRFGEIWWHFPYGQDAEECNRVIIYNVREQCWYDTAQARGAGMRARVFRYPVMAGVVPNALGKYSLYTHEFGVDAVDGDAVVAIEASMETCSVSMLDGIAQPVPATQNTWTRVTRMEPDFKMVGNLSVQFSGESTANSPEQTGEEHIIDSTTPTIDLREQYRHMRITVRSGEVGGYFEAGRVLLHLETGDVKL